MGSSLREYGEANREDVKESGERSNPVAGRRTWLKVDVRIQRSRESDGILDSSDHLIVSWQLSQLRILESSYPAQDEDVLTRSRIDERRVK